jgi:proteasome lid subunit RPN8/RPN11
VENAISYQTAERTKNQVEIMPKHELRCKDMLYKLCSLEVIGDFHSHPDWDATLSKTDVDNMDLGSIEIIISVNPKKRTTPWRYDSSTKELCGVFGDYRFAIATYSCFKKKGTKKCEKIDIVCPFALGIGSKFMDTNARMPV